MVGHRQSVMWMPVTPNPITRQGHDTMQTRTRFPMTFHTCTLLALLATLPACESLDDGDGGDDGYVVASSDRGLIGSPGSRWPSLGGQGQGHWVSSTEIVVCFDESKPPVIPALRDQANSAMDEIEEVSGVRFLYRGDCWGRPDPGSAAYIRVVFSDSTPGCASGNGGCAIPMANPWWLISFGQATDGSRYVFLHEFFHALGFHHEHERSDDDDSCADSPESPGTTDYLTPLDSDSIMYYCDRSAEEWEEVYGDGMTYWDRVGLRTYYGMPGNNIALAPGGFVPVAIGPSSPHPTFDLDAYHSASERRYTRTVELRDLVPGEEYEVLVVDSPSPVYLSFHPGDEEDPMWTSSATTQPRHRFTASALGRDAIRISLPVDSSDVRVAVALERGAQAHYPLTGASGDDAGARHDATPFLSTGSVVPDGVVGEGYHFAGSDVFVASISPPTVATALAISAWVRDVGTGSSRTIVSKGHGGDGATTDYIFAIQDQTLQFFGNGAWHSAPITLDGDWTHVGVTYDGSDVRLYADGALLATISSPGQLYASSAPLQIGRQGHACQCNYFVGNLDELKIFDRVLDEAEMSALASVTSARAIVPVYAETLQSAPHSLYHFSTRSAAEAAQFGWQQLGVAFYAFDAPVPGTVPVYSETPSSAPDSQYHLSTRSAAEAALYSWQQLGVAFHAFPDASSWNQAVYSETPTAALHSQYHFSTRSAVEAAEMGWTQLAPAFHGFRP